MKLKPERLIRNNEYNSSAGEDPGRVMPSEASDQDRALLPDQASLRQVIDCIGDPIVMADKTGRVISLDPLARQLFGSPDTPQPTEIAANQLKLDAYLAGFTFSFPQRQNKTLHFYDPRSRSEVDFAVRSTKIYDKEGRLTSTITVLRDFSEWWSNERSELVRRIMEMEKFAATGKLAGTIAHEINNPMEAIKNAIYLLKDRLTPDAQPIYDALKSEADRVTRIVRQMLGLYRNAAYFGKFDLNAVVEDTFTLFARPLEKSGIVVSKRLGSLPTIKGSADQFRQLLSNLVINAQDSMNHGRLIVRTRFIPSAREGYGQVSIVVADTGSGIASDLRAKMFDPFISTKGEKGTGLGLWIVQGIVECHAGRIQVRSRVGKGTVFKLWFPVSDNS